MENENQSIPKGRKGYLFKMAAKMAMKQGKKYLNSHPDSKFQTLLEQADILVNHVGRLKGAAMKAIQTLSVEGHDFLPPEVIEVLEKLQSQAPPLPRSILMKVIKEELGDKKFAQLENISEKPIAAASIGQVFSANYKGEAVVIKVQYPGVAESVDADIDTLKKLLKAMLVVTNKKIQMDDLMEEVRRILKLETDYRHEEQALIRYRDLFEGSQYKIPKVYTEFTANKVIVLSYEEGQEFGVWLKTDPSLEMREQVGRELLELYTKEFFENHLVQTDPNPANFLVQKDGRMVLLDFGATIEFDEQFVKNYQKLLRAVFSKDKEKIEKSIMELNFISPKEDEETKQGFIDFLIYSLSPFEAERQPFDFKDDQYSSEVRERAMGFSRKLKYSAPPRQLIFLHRKLGGIFMLLKKLQVKADLTPFREKVMTIDY